MVAEPDIHFRGPILLQPLNRSLGRKVRFCQVISQWQDFFFYRNWKVIFKKVFLYETVSGWGPGVVRTVNKTPQTLRTEANPNILVPNCSWLTQLSTHALHLCNIDLIPVKMTIESKKTPVFRRHFGKKILLGPVESKSSQKLLPSTISC